MPWGRLGGKAFVAGVLFVFGGCSAITSFDSFVGTGDAGTSPSATSSGSAGSSGVLADGGSSGTSVMPDPDPCVMKSTGKTAAGVVGQGDNDDYPSWQDTTNARLRDSDPAFVTFLGRSRSLVASNFGFAIPIQATIVGVQATIVVRHAVVADGGTGPAPRDSRVGLVLGSSSLGDDHAKPEKLLTSFEDRTYGGPNDLWGAPSITADAVNSPGFGLSYTASHQGAGNALVEVDYLELEVFYCE
jgi:hypothetical protein